jgi:protein-S-isoprenylcysteine O-methyltransferase Ste14
VAENIVPGWAPLAALSIMGLSTGFIAMGLSRKGVKAIVLPSGDDAHAYLGKVFKVCILIGTAFCVAHAIAPGAVAHLGPLPWLVSPLAAEIGLALMIVGSLLVVAAQLNMGHSWRVGIDRANHTELVTTGLHRISRNPIYAGMFAAILGIFLVAPNAVTLSLLAISAATISTQVRLEEDHLGRLHGADYAAYRARTRRWI